MSDVKVVQRHTTDFRSKLSSITQNKEPPRADQASRIHAHIKSICETLTVFSTIEAHYNQQLGQIEVRVAAGGNDCLQLIS